MNSLAKSIAVSLIGASLSVLYAQGGGSEIGSLAISPDGKTVVAGYADGEVVLWDIATGKARPFERRRDRVRSVAFSMDGTKLAAGSDDGFITIRDTSTGQLLKELREPWTGNAYPRVYSVRFSPDGNTVLTGALQLALWDVTSGTRLRKLDYALDRGNTIGNVFATFSPSGKSIATGASDAGITIVDTTTFKLFGALRGHSKWVHCVAFSADGKTLASASDDGKIKVWDLASGDEVRSLSGESEFMMSVAFSADGKMLASAGGSGDGNEGRVKIWEAGSGKELQTLNQKSRVDAVSFTPDGASVITGSYDGTLRVWSTANWSVVRKMPEGGLIR